MVTLAIVEKYVMNIRLFKHLDSPKAREKSFLKNFFIYSKQFSYLFVFIVNI